MSHTLISKTRYSETITIIIVYGLCVCAVHIYSSNSHHIMMPCIRLLLLLYTPMLYDACIGVHSDN